MNTYLFCRIKNSGDKMLVKKNKLWFEGLELETLEVELKGTTLLLIEGYGAFFMCGALDVDIYKDREVVCGREIGRASCRERAVGVKTIVELFNAPIQASTQFAKTKGIVPGMKVYEAFKKVRQEE